MRIYDRRRILNASPMNDDRRKTMRINQILARGHKSRISNVAISNVFGNNIRPSGIAAATTTTHYAFRTRSPCDRIAIPKMPIRSHCASAHNEIFVFCEKWIFAWNFLFLNTIQTDAPVDNGIIDPISCIENIEWQIFDGIAIFLSCKCWQLVGTCKTY